MFECLLNIVSKFIALVVLVSFVVVVQISY